VKGGIQEVKIFWRISIITAKRCNL